MATPPLPFDGAQLQVLISLLSQMGGGINPTLMSSAYPNNVSPAGIKSSFSPEILMASGLVSPDVLNQLTAAQLADLKSEYAGNIQSRLPYEASDAVLSKYTSKYLGNDIVSSFMQSAFDRISSGAETADTVLARINESKETPSEVKDALAKITPDLDGFSQSVIKRNDALAKFEYDQQGQLNTLGPAPTAADARMALFDKLGVPQMALLGDPNAAYEFDPSNFVDKEKITGYEKALRDAVIAQNNARANASGAIAQGNLQNSYSMKALEEQARLYAENATKDMKTNSAWTEDLGSIFGTTAAGLGVGAAAGATPTLGIGAPFGAAVGGASGLIGGIVDWATGRNDDKYKKAKEEALKVAYDKELARLKMESPSLSLEEMRVKYSPDYRVTVENAKRAKSNIALEQAYGQQVADALAKELTSRGITPYSQNLNQLLGYAIQTAK